MGLYVFGALLAHPQEVYTSGTWYIAYVSWLHQYRQKYIETYMLICLNFPFCNIKLYYRQLMCVKI
jgi:hypothetical protein